MGGPVPSTVGCSWSGWSKSNYRCCLAHHTLGLNILCTCRIYNQHIFYHGGWLGIPHCRLCKPHRLSRCSIFSGPNLIVCSTLNKYSLIVLLTYHWTSIMGHLGCYGLPPSDIILTNFPTTFVDSVSLNSKVSPISYIVSLKHIFLYYFFLPGCPFWLIPCWELPPSLNI